MIYIFSEVKGFFTVFLNVLMRLCCGLQESYLGDAWYFYYFREAESKFTYFIYIQT